MSSWRASKAFLRTLLQSYRQQVDSLPTQYLRQFFRIKYGDDVHAINKTPVNEQRYLKTVRRVQKTVRKIEAVNAGRPKALDTLLDFAYGRRGRMRWELIQPMIPASSNQPKPERIIPAVEKSRPPVFSPELSALLTASHSRMSKPLSPQDLKTPSKLPAKADPNSEAARYFGPFSKRREVNIRWRHFAGSHRKVYPPIQTIHEVVRQSGEIERSTNKDKLLRAGIRTPVTQETNIFQEVEDLARPPPIPLTRREKRLYSSPDRQVADVSSLNSHLPKRFLRRSYQRLLSRLPLLVYTQRPSRSSQRSGTLAVRVSRYALTRGNHPGVVEADESDVAWIGTPNKRRSALT